MLSRDSIQRLIGRYAGGTSTSYSRREAPYTIRRWQTSDAWMYSIVQREVFTYNRGTVITISGSPYRKTGVGKSWAALRIGEWNDPDYQDSAWKVVYNVGDFIRVYDKVEEIKRPGQVVILDEAGSLVDARAWYGIANKVINYTVQTVRYLRPVTVVVAPQRNLLDKRVRELTEFHIRMDVKIGSGGRRLYVATPYRVYSDDLEAERYDPRRGEYYSRGEELKPLWVWDERLRREYVVRESPVSPVQSERLVEEYERMAARFKRQLRDKMSKEVERFESKLRREVSGVELEKIARVLASDRDFIRSVYSRTQSGKVRIDKSILGLALEKSFPEYKFSEKSIGLLAKLIEQVLYLRSVED